MSPPSRSLLLDPAHFIALGFGAGLVPKLPGTAGSLVGVLLFLAARDLSWPVYLCFVTAIAAIGTIAAHRSSRLLEDKDPGCIVIDEVAGMLLALCWLPPEWIWLIVAFVLFRLFDIFKPWPIGLADRRVSGGFGIMLDDILAGAFTLACVQLLYYLSL